MESGIDVAGAAALPQGEDSGLSDRDLRILEFERQWWRYAGAKEQAIRELFECSTTRYYQMLNTLIDDPAALKAVAAAWRQSLGAGFCGAAASGLWFTAMAMSPVGPVRAVGVVEMPIAALAGRRLFAERLTPVQWLAGAITAFGVVMAALG